MNECRSAAAGLLRVTAPPDDGGVVWAMLTGFIRDHPDVDVEVVHTLDRVDLIAENIDAALRGGTPPDSTVLYAGKLVDSRPQLVASPDYAAQGGMPERPDELAEHRCCGLASRACAPRWAVSRQAWLRPR